MGGHTDGSQFQRWLSSAGYTSVATANAVVIKCFRNERRSGLFLELCCIACDVVCVCFEQSLIK